MLPRALSAARALVPLSLSLSLVGCSLAYCGDDAFRRERELRSGEIAGTALVPGPKREPAAFVQASVRGTSFVRRTNSEGRFVFSGLAEGPWMVTVNEDLDGDGRPERRRVVSAILREAPHRTSPSYVPFVESEGQPRLTGVDVGEVVLEGTVRVEGRVMLDGPGGPKPPVERGRVAVVVAGRNLDLSSISTEEVEVSHLVSLGAEVKTGVDDQGRFVLRNVSGGEIFLLVLVYELGLTPGAPGELVQVSDPIALSAQGEKKVVEGDIVLPSDLGVSLRPVQIVFSPPPSPAEQAYLTLVPPGTEMPPCEDAPIDYTGSPFPWARTTPQVSVSGSDAPVFSQVPVGVWDIQACFTTSPPGTLFAQTVAPETADEKPVLLGPVLLTELDACKPTRTCEADADCGDGFTCDEAAGICVAPDESWRDCDGDGVRGLPPITNEDERQLWEDCVSACFASPGEPVGDLTCTASDGNVYDCDDDGDGQADVTEAQECYGVGRGTDSDGDGICDGVDPFPDCRANTAEECEAGDEPDEPQVPEAYGGDSLPDEQCPVQRDPEGSGYWCEAVAGTEDEELCPIASMRCMVEVDSPGAPPICHAASGLGCPFDMVCLDELANDAGMAPCADPGTAGCEDGCEDGWSCGTASVNGESLPLCISDLGEGPALERTPYTCDCCGPDGLSCRSLEGVRNFWSPTICSDEELSSLWSFCYSNTELPDPPGQGDPDCPEIAALEDLDGINPLPACVTISSGTLTIEGGTPSSVLDLGGLEELRGSLIVQGTNLMGIHAPGLSRVHGDLFINENAELAALNLPFTELQVTGRLGVWRNPQLVAPFELINVGAAEVSVSANGCVEPIDCEPFGLPYCEVVHDESQQPLFGGEMVCHRCSGAGDCELPETCDVDFVGIGTGTFQCVVPDGGNPP